MAALWGDKRKAFIFIVVYFEMPMNIRIVFSEGRHGKLPRSISERVEIQDNPRLFSYD